MDWAKIDAPLASALSGAGDGDMLSVFVHLDPAHPDAGDLGVGLGTEPDGSGMHTASLSPAEVAALTDRPAVRRISLSGRLRLLGDG